MSDIETRLFRYFVALAEEQHFARAAVRLGITPPTLTHQIKKLEGELEVKLVERKGNTHVLMTEAGQRFFARAQEVLRQIDEAAAIARQAERGEIGRIDLGYMTSVCFAGLLQSWIGEFQRANPAIDITMRRLVPMGQIAGIIRNEIDAGFTRTPHKYPAGVHGLELYRQPMVLALPSDHPLARRKDIGASMLRDETFVNTTPELDVGFFGHTEAVAGIGKFTPRVVKRNDDFLTVLTYVAIGYGIAVVPQLMKRLNVPNVVFRDIAANPIPETSIAFVYGSKPSPSTRLLIKHMERHALTRRPSASARIRAVS
jgi:DNA-binding transcriptional LysR family regulator